MLCAPAKKYKQSFVDVDACVSVIAKLKETGVEVLRVLWREGSPGEGVKRPTSACDRLFCVDVHTRKGTTVNNSQHVSLQHNNMQSSFSHNSILSPSHRLSSIVSRILPKNSPKPFVLPRLSEFENVLGRLFAVL